MSSKTPNLALNIWGREDHLSVSEWTENFTRLDSAVPAAEQAAKDAAKQYTDLAIVQVEQQVELISQSVNGAVLDVSGFNQRLSAAESEVEGVATNIQAVQDQMGDLDDLPTDDKSSLVTAISEVFTQVVNGKSLLATTINDKGGTITGSELTFAELDDGIKSIPTGKKTASGTYPPSGDTFTNVTVTGLDFLPSAVVITSKPGPTTYNVTVYDRATSLTHYAERQNQIQLTDPYMVVMGGFTLMVRSHDTPITWHAYE